MTSENGGFMARIGWGLVLLASCTEAPLTPVQGVGTAPVDDILAVRGNICTLPPLDEDFPVKVLLVADTSNSLQFTDMANQRVVAVQRLLNRYAGNPAVQFAVIAFDAVVSDITGGFTSNPDIAAITTRLTNADRLTDYQGALGAAYNTLSLDMQNASAAQRARTKYVVIFFSDGSPDPKCEFGAPPGTQLLVCEIDRDEWPDTFTLPGGTNPNTGVAWTWDDFQGLYPQLDAGKDYNTRFQLLAKVQEIMDLQQIYNVNELRFHTGFLFDPNTIQAAIIAFGLNRQAGIDLMTEMAMVGNGTFTEFSSGASVNFLNINYASAKQAYAMTNLIVSNESAVPLADKAVEDSDGDGLHDLLEDELRTCSYTRGGANCNPGMGLPLRDPLDHDGDGYSDFFEHRFRSSGFDPASANALTAPCTDIDDTDGDGLKDCEEAFIGTNIRLPDHDGDRMPDGIEFHYGLDPLDREDALQDDDADGTINSEEVLKHYTPLAKEPTHALPPHYEYTVTWLGETPEGKNCYDYDIQNIRLKATRSSTPENKGLNRIRLTFMEGPPDDPRDYGTMRVACAEARYVAPDLKLPADGRMEVLESDFYSPTDPALTCVPPVRERPSEDMPPAGS